MPQDGETDVQEPIMAIHLQEDEEEFVLQLAALDSGRLEGFVLHPRSGQREPVTEWDDLTRIITDMLATSDGRVAPELG
jgi:hypothetical protein